MALQQENNSLPCFLVIKKDFKVELRTRREPSAFSMLLKPEQIPCFNGFELSDFLHGCLQENSKLIRSQVAEEKKAVGAAVSEEALQKKRKRNREVCDLVDTGSHSVDGA